MDTGPLSDMSFENIFSYSVSCLLVFFALCKKAFYLDEVPVVLYLCFFGDVSSKKLLQARSQRLLPVFSSRILMDSCLTFRSCIHFCVWCKKVVQFHLLHVAVQFSQHCLLKRLSFFQWIFFPALSKSS